MTFVLKDGSEKTIFVQEIENEDDDKSELIFVTQYNNTKDIWTSKAVSTGTK